MCFGVRVVRELRQGCGIAECMCGLMNECLKGAAKGVIYRARKEHGLG